MANGFTTIREAIYTVLQTVTRAQEVYNYYPTQPAGYPCIMFDVSESENSFLTNEQNKRTLTWTIYVMVTVNRLHAGTMVQTAGAALDDICDEVVDVLEADGSLGGVVDWSLPLTGGRDEVETPQGMALVQTLVLTTVVGTDCA
jgi:hypothetical protein